ncbi:acetyl-CoA carboxylase biotin carboxyl carrier protein [Pseudobacillus badius]|uniref:acetyl-CoA carboxylase biotin carboxyl carrier protein n=1 Tax=Bacillus badius TaxID=1455 RepID=UPI000596BC9C|nr:acetyl-CoA carboxylase biotin carboxyl carrier protein [Bacillus badius]KIL75257.1 Biotin carboxyl carrier protein of acetyl-CoA carboxylase [Bacillus badius]KZR60343.1 acetyl-CoA carboxylase, biotin carboxyl carrier protein [Bacillus badius]
MKVQEIRELIKLVDQSSIEEFVFETEGSKIEMKKNTGVTYSPAPQAVPAQEPVQAAAPAPVQAAPAVPAAEPAVQETAAPEAPQQAASNENLHKITSPMVGTFYQSPSPDADVYVKAGSKVSADTVVCIVEAMKLFNEIEAEVEGEIVEVLVKDGQLVEYGQPLFLVKPQ